MKKTVKKEMWEELHLEVISIESEDIITTSTTSKEESGREPGEGELD